MAINTKNSCQAISTKNKQCKNKRLRFSQYCFYHQPKVIPLLTLILGGIIGLIIDITWIAIFPPKSETRRNEVVRRISMEASGAIKYTDAFLTEYLNALGEDKLIKQIRNLQIQDASKYFDSDLDIELEKAFQNSKMLEGSNMYNSNGQQIAYIANALWNVKNTRAALNDFLKKYGSVDDELVTTVIQMKDRADVVIMILNYAFKNPNELKIKFRKGQMEPFADFLSGFYIYQFECKTLIENEIKN
ncbi:hypothetical protein [Sunxiuqinia indica]|uniref:hypothetical protein n=1 Tax=Sunxiuqinia indica TaxID=2692584 RepID=UPI00135BF4A2|nr:hypothetical protein [Sunxiuqinia indica]